MVQAQLCDYIKLKYPGVIFRSDEAGVNKTSRYAQIQAVRLQSDRGYPDMQIAEPRGNWHALFIEIKRDETELKLKRNGTRRKAGDWATDHIEEQAKMLERLTELGYYAVFGIGLDACCQIVDEYMELRRTP